MGLLVQANQMLAQGQVAAASELRSRAFEAAPATPGAANDQPLEWIADADSRLGPMIEAIIDGKYYWVPFFRVRSVRTEPPQDLRDLVWTAAQFVWANGGESPGFIPTRYPGSENATDSSLRLARKTEWIDRGEDLYTGCGQRMFATDQAEIALTETRKIEFEAHFRKEVCPTQSLKRSSRACWIVLRTKSLNRKRKAGTNASSLCGVIAKA